MNGTDCTLPCEIPVGVQRIEVDRASFLLPSDFRPIGSIPSPIGMYLFRAIYYF